MTDSRSAFDLITAVAIFLLSLAGIIRRCRREIGLRRIKLVEPIHQSDVEYLKSVKWSTHLRLGVKVVLFIGSLIMLFDLPLFEFWRLGLVIALVFMNIETVSVDRIRERLGRAGSMR